VLAEYPLPDKEFLINSYHVLAPTIGWPFNIGVEPSEN
jgi:hypothetical protein